MGSSGETSGRHRKAFATSVSMSGTGPRTRRTPDTPNGGGRSEIALTRTGRTDRGWSDPAGARSGGDGGLDRRNRFQGEGIRRRRHTPGAGDLVGATAEGVARLVEVAVDVAVTGRFEAPLRGFEDVVLGEELRVHPRMHGGIGDRVEIVVVGVPGAEPQAGQPRVHVLEPVVAVSDV